MEDNVEPRERMTTGDEMKKKEMILDDIVAKLSEALNISSTDISSDMNITEDLPIDSLMLYELVIDLEEAYNIRLPDELLDVVTTLDDVVDLVYKLSQADEV